MHPLARKALGGLAAMALLVGTPAVTAAAPITVVSFLDPEVGGGSGDPFANPEAFSFSFSAQTGGQLGDATFEGAQVRWTSAMTGSAEASIDQVPEPGAMLLLGIGLLASAGLFRRRLLCGSRGRRATATEETRAQWPVLPP